jgi:hypothetical protein
LGVRIKSHGFHHGAYIMMARFGVEMGKFGFSWSWKRALGISGARASIARKTGIPTTRGGVERKIGRMILEMFFGRKR